MRQRALFSGKIYYTCHDLYKRSQYRVIVNLIGSRITNEQAEDQNKTFIGTFGLNNSPRGCH